jgi:predicted type IV restriction endonuclease
MDLIDRLRELSARIPKQLEHIQTEEATKNALVMPFIAALGYNVFDPTEVTPELHADVGVKKGEKVDYAILKDGKPIMLFECKAHRADLSKEHASQLYRYFSVTEARFGVLTNGLQYWFYSDLDAPNKMDAKPFFEFNLLDIREQDVEELKKFSKSAFDLAGIITTASELKYTREIKRIMGEQLNEPSDDFIKFFVTQMQVGRMNAAQREQFVQGIRRGMKSFISDQVNQRLKTALGSDSRIVSDDLQPSAAPAAEVIEATTPIAVVTTAEELEAYYVIKALLHDAVEPRRIVMRDVQSYCSVLLDDNNRRPICRLYFNGPTKAIGLFDNEQRKEQRLPLPNLDELYTLGDRLRSTVRFYASPKADKPATT